MTRRTFLAACSSSIVGLCVAAKIPTRYLPEPILRLSAVRAMAHEVDRWEREERITPSWDADMTFSRPLEELHAASALFAAYDREIITNSSASWSLGARTAARDMVTEHAFRDIPLFEAKIPGWTLVLVAAPRPWDETHPSNAIITNVLTGERQRMIFNRRGNSL